MWSLEKTVFLAASKYKKYIGICFCLFVCLFVCLLNVQFVVNTQSAMKAFYSQGKSACLLA